MQERLRTILLTAGPAGEATSSAHTPIEMPMFAENGCAAEDCTHEDECPTFVAVVCLECNTAAQGSTDPVDWEGPVAPCPIFGVGVPREQADALIVALAVTDRTNRSEETR